MCDPVAPLTTEQLESAISTVEQGCHDKLDEAEARGSACYTEYVDALECIVELDCDEFRTEWVTRDEASPCYAHWERVEHACGDLPLEPQDLDQALRKSRSSETT
jgi:hypothetical protein